MHTLVRMRFLRFLTVLSFLAFITSATTTSVIRENEKSEIKIPSLKWWQETVIYQIYPRSFQDSDGDGVGDLNGVQSRLDYLVDLGVETIWLSPIYKSPMKDFGYDVSNFTDVDPTFGTLADFENLSSAARARGLKLVMDWIPNHSSDLHEWFLKSVDRIEPYTDFYTWHDGKRDENGTRTPPNNWVSFFTGSMWEWNAKRGQYYLHQFVKEQPDLRLENPEVESRMLSAMKFWLDRGVDGFRIDAVPSMFENQSFPDERKNEIHKGALPTDYEYWEHKYTFNLPKVLDSLRLYRILLDIYTVTDDRPRLMMTEGYISDYADLMKYYGTPAKPIAHFPFNFDLITKIEGNVTARALKATIDDWLNHMPQGGWANWLVGNHDNHRIADRFGKNLVDATNMLVLLLPGTAITYYGEEIGMENTFLTWEQNVDPWGCNAGHERYHLFSRDPERTPMQWDSTKNAGFSSAANTWLPLNKNYLTLNVAVQNTSAESHLKVYKALTRLRKSDPWRYGALETKTFAADIFGFTRILDGKGFLVLINFGDSDVVVNASSFASVPAVGIVYTRSVGFRDNTIVIGSRVSIVSVKLPSKNSLVLTF